MSAGDPLKVRPLERRDHNSALEIAGELSPWFDADALTRAIPADLRHQTGFVAVMDDRIVGFITLFFAEGRLNIGWLGVRPDYQGKEVGSQLLACAEEFGRQRGVTELATFTLSENVDYPPYEQTRHFYFHRGFSVYQRNRTDNPSCPEEIKIKKTIGN